MSAETRDCPACCASARPVPMTTVRALLSRLPPGAWTQAWYCGSRHCPVVYFDQDGDVREASALRVRVFDKETADDRPACYCFGHSVADVLDAGNALVEAITAECRAGRARCAEANPAGRCCLGGIRALVRAPGPSCCGD